MTTVTADGMKVTGVDDQILQLLGSGLSNEVVASAVGRSPQYVSNLLADDTFKKAVGELRFKALQSHNVRDSRYNDVEDRLLTKLEENLDTMYKPREILSAIAVINKAQRRGISTPEQITATREVVPLTLPPAVINKFSVNVHNQVIQAGEQNLITIQSDSLNALAGVSSANLKDTRNQNKNHETPLELGDVNDALRISRDIASGRVLPASKVPEGDYAGGRLTYRSIAAGIKDKVAALSKQS